MNVRCTKCGAAWEIPGPVGVREECPECAAYVHTCAACAHHEPQRGGCTADADESIRDPAGQNFCDQFDYGPGGAAKAPPPAVAPGPGADRAAEARRRFEDLFGDGDA